MIEAKNNGAGGICADNRGEIRECINLGIVTTAENNNEDYYFLGGIIAQNKGSVSRCFNGGIIEIEENRGNTFLGGIVGINFNNQIANITDCYSTLSETKANCVGGICGLNSSQISNCYYYTENNYKGIGSQSQSTDIIEPVEDDNKITKKLEEKIDSYEDFIKIL